MSHALIIDDNVILSRAIRSRLEAFGFDSFDYTWAEQQALEAAASRAPDLIVVGDTIAGGSPLGVAGRLAASGDVPVLFVTTQSFRRSGEPPTVNSSMVRTGSASSIRSLPHFKRAD